MSIKITGIKAIDKKLSKMTPALVKKALRQAIRPALKPLQADVKSNVPRESGNYAKAIKVKSGKRSKIEVSAQVIVSNETYKGDGFPGIFQEYGTKYIKPSGDFRRTYDEGGDKAKQEAERNLLKIVMSGIK